MWDAQLTMQTMLSIQYIMVKIQEGIQGQVGILSQPPDYISNP
jgi:hypothetical protein